MHKLILGTEKMLEFGGIKKDILFLVLSGIALVISIFDLLPLPFDAAWIAILPVSYTHLTLPTILRV